MIILLLLLVFGLAALIKGEFNITRNRVVTDRPARWLGILSIGLAAAGLFVETGLISLIVVCVVGLILSKPKSAVA